jgi:hypothetical protein
LEVNLLLRELSLSSTDDVGRRLKDKKHIRLRKETTEERGEIRKR